MTKNVITVENNNALDHDINTEATQETSSEGLGDTIKDAQLAPTTFANEETNL